MAHSETLECCYLAGNNPRGFHNTHQDVAIAIKVSGSKVKRCYKGAEEEEEEEEKKKDTLETKL